MLSSGITEKKISKRLFTCWGVFAVLQLAFLFPSHQQTSAEINEEAMPWEEVFLALFQKEMGFPLFPAHLSDRSSGWLIYLPWHNLMTLSIISREVPDFSMCYHQWPGFTP